MLHSSMAYLSHFPGVLFQAFSDSVSPSIKIPPRFDWFKNRPSWQPLIPLPFDWFENRPVGIPSLYACDGCFKGAKFQFQIQTFEHDIYLQLDFKNFVHVVVSIHHDADFDISYAFWRPQLQNIWLFLVWMGRE